jgi:hypothetical protein
LIHSYTQLILVDININMSSSVIWNNVFGSSLCCYEIAYASR